MRVTFGIASVVGLGLSVTVALGQGAGQRGAKLLAPRAADPDEGRVQVRAAAEPLPEFPGSTPVAGPRPGKGPVVAYQPGYDAGVRTAGTVTPEKGPPRPVAPKDEPSLVSRGLDKIKSTFVSAPPAPGAATGPDAANPNAPFRGTSPTGQTVYAGPPAYRWYGWGSVTPGANPYAPNGQFPRASANWYAITGATPGAFPTQVTDPYRVGTGTEPPAYVAPAAPPPPPVTTYAPPPQYRQPQPQPQPAQVVPRASSMPLGSAAPRPLPIPETYVPPTPTLTPIPSVGAALPVVPAVPAPTTTVPAGNPAVALTPLPVAETEPAGSRVVTAQPLTLAPMLPRGGEQPPSLAAIPTIPTLPVANGGGAPSSVPPVVAPPAPAPLPISVTADEPRWQPTPTVPAPAPIDWNPAGGKR